MVFLNALTKGMFNSGTTRSRTKVNGSACFAEGLTQKKVAGVPNVFQADQAKTGKMQKPLNCSAVVKSQEINEINRNQM